MRWFFVNCILLATATDVLSRHRTKRDLSYIKNLIASKILGTETIYIHPPEISENETYQLFKIQGYDDILLKVTKKPDKKEEKVQVQENEKAQDPVIVKPDIAIIGSYLGTTTQGETLLAMDIAKNLVKSGILNSESDKLIHQVVVPMTSQLPYKDYIAQGHVASENVLTEQKNLLFVYPHKANEAERIQVVNRMPDFPVQMPPLVVASDIKFRPVQTKYSYTQKGENADITYESLNNQDVIVTRKEKVPPLLQYIKMRFADVASIGANPYLIRSQQPVGVIAEEHLMPPMKIAPAPYAYVHPSMVLQQHMQPISSTVMQQFPASVSSFGVIEDPGYVVANNIRPSVVGHGNPTLLAAPSTAPNFVKHSRQPFDIRSYLTAAELHNINQYVNGELSKNTDKFATLKMPPSNKEVSDENLINTMKKESANKDRNQSYELTKSTESNGVVSKYMYKQINRHSADNFTVVKLEDPPKLIQGNPLRRTNVDEADNVPKDFVFMPPNNVDIPLPNMIPKTNNIYQNTKRVENAQTENYNKIIGLNKSGEKELKDEAKNTGTLKTSETNSLNNNPIVVLGLNDTDEKEKPTSTYKGNNRNYTHMPYKGGPIF